MQSSLVFKVTMKFCWRIFTFIFVAKSSVDALWCSTEEFMCGQGTHCIKKEDLCDGYIDCPDSSDETTDICKYRSCSENVENFGTQIDWVAIGDENYFQCNYGACISPRDVCNGMTNCLDGSDETQELCNENRCTHKFRCEYGACVDKSSTCNGRIDCRDRSDETVELCAKKRCTRYHFQCSYGACIAKRRKCDGKIHCADGSDEEESVCGKNASIASNKFQKRPLKTVKFLPRIITKNDDVPPSAAPTAAASLKMDDLQHSDYANFLQLLFNPKTFESDNIMPAIMKMISSSTPLVSETPEHNAIENLIPKDELTSSISNTSGLAAILNLTPKLTTVYVTPKPIVYKLTPEPSLSCPKKDNCRCPSPLEFLCIPCDLPMNFIDVCHKIGDDSLCSTQIQEMDTIHILTCGPEYEPLVDLFSRIATTCGNEFGVPVLTSVFVHCWASTSFVGICHPDGVWRIESRRDRNEVMTTLCQTEQINSIMCGNFANVLSDVNVTNVRNGYVWPFLVAIYYGEEFKCTGTIISGQWILTAAHCLVENAENETSIFNITIKFESPDQTNTSIRVLNMYSSSKFTVESHSASAFTNDVGLLELEESILFSNKIFPACINTHEDIFSKPGMTFKSKVLEKKEVTWDMSVESIDVRCYNREHHCTKPLDVGRTEFCSTNADLERGSSGGPFLINVGSESEERWSISGIVSYKIGSGNCSFVVYSFAHLHLEWIKNCVEQGIC